MKVIKHQKNKLIKVILLAGVFILVGIGFFVINNNVLTKIGIYNQLRGVDRLSIISNSPSGRYVIRKFPRPKLYDTLALVSPTKTYLLFPMNHEFDFHNDIYNKNVAWSHDKNVVVITYVPYTEKVSDTTATMLLVSTKTGEVINKVNLGKGAFYGVSKNHAFYPVISPDGEFIVVQRDLIHKLSIYDLQGRHIKDLNTKYAGVDLFSPEMYELENSKYSPFLEYKWSDNGKNIPYRFLGTQKYYEARLRFSTKAH